MGSFSEPLSWILRIHICASLSDLSRPASARRLFFTFYVWRDFTGENLFSRGMGLGGMGLGWQGFGMMKESLPHVVAFLHLLPEEHHIPTRAVGYLMNAGMRGCSTSNICKRCCAFRG
jgi:hypothetical protein